MQVVPSTIITLLLLVWLLRKGPYAGLSVLFFSIPFGMMAAVNLPAVGRTSILASDLIVILLFVMLLLRKQTLDDFGRLLTPGQAALPILAFLGYAILSTVFFPRLFDGETEVFRIARGPTGTAIQLEPLRASVGNISQFFRMILSLGVFAVSALVMLRQRDPAFALKLMILVSLVHAGLGIVDILTQGLGATWVLEPIRTANYALTLGQKTVGLNRLIGGFPEASAYGYVSLAIFGFWLSYWFHSQRSRRWPMAMMLLSLFLVLRGTSSSAYVGAALLVIVFAGQRLREVLRGGGTLDPRLAGALAGGLALLPITLVGLYLLYELQPGFAAFIDRTLLDKLASDSGVERMSWNAQALRNMVDTYFLGAGLGSIRASSWVAATLGSTGLIGFGLMLAFLWRLFAAPLSQNDPAARHVALALKLGLIGCLARAVVVRETPNLDFIFFAMAGLLVGLTLSSRTSAAAQPVPHAARRTV